MKVENLLGSMIIDRFMLSNLCGWWLAVALGGWGVVLWWGWWEVVGEAGGQPYTKFNVHGYSL